MPPPVRNQGNCVVYVFPCGHAADAQDGAVRKRVSAHPWRADSNKQADKAVSLCLAHGGKQTLARHHGPWPAHTVLRGLDPGCRCLPYMHAYKRHKTRVQMAKRVLMAAAIYIQYAPVSWSLEDHLRWLTTCLGCFPRVSTCHVSHVHTPKCLPRPYWVCEQLTRGGSCRQESCLVAL